MDNEPIGSQTIALRAMDKVIPCDFAGFVDGVYWSDNLVVVPNSDTFYIGFDY